MPHATYYILMEEEAQAQRVAWIVRPLEGQKIVKRCPGCEMKRNFASSGAFRVNAQKKTIDVWHIYKCERCGNTWNIEVIARTNRRKINPELYNSYLQNDEDEARRKTFDYGLLARNRAELASPPDFAVDGPGLDELAGRARINLTSEFLLPIRLERVLVKKFGLSRRQLVQLIESGRLTGVAVQDLPRRVKGDIAFEIEVEYARAMLRKHDNMQEAEVEAFNRRQATAIEDLQ
jgi:hypothetical protein